MARSSLITRDVPAVRRHLGEWFEAASLTLLISACIWGGGIDDPNRDVISADNDFAFEVDVAYLVDGVEQHLVTIPPGDSLALDGLKKGACTTGTLIARDEDGEEVERRPPGFCPGTEWHIDGDPRD